MAANKTSKTTGAIKSARPDGEIIAFDDARAFHAWLDAHHGTSPGIWLKLQKKRPGIAALTYAEAIDEALIFGWIDGQKRPFDDAHWLQRFTRRGPKSIWSKINRAKADALVAAGRMKPAGLEELTRAKADGRLDAAYEGSRTMGVPDDLEAALAKNKRAREFFATLKSANRYAVLFRIHTAKKAETRARWVEKIVAMLAKHETFH